MRALHGHARGRALPPDRGGVRGAPAAAAGSLWVRRDEHHNALDVHFASSAQDEACVFAFEQDQSTPPPGSRREPRSRSARASSLDRPPGRPSVPDPAPPPARTPKRSGRASSASGRGCRGGAAGRRAGDRGRHPRLTAFHHAGKKTVPDLTGQTLAQAESALRKARPRSPPGRSRPNRWAGEGREGRLPVPLAQAKVKQDTPVRSRSASAASRPRPRRMRQVLRGRPAGADGESSHRRPGAARDGDAGQHDAPDRLLGAGGRPDQAGAVRNAGQPVHAHGAPVRWRWWRWRRRPFHHRSGCPSRRPRPHSPEPGDRYRDCGAQSLRGGHLAAQAPAKGARLAPRDGVPVLDGAADRLRRRRCGQHVGDFVASGTSSSTLVTAAPHRVCRRRAQLEPRHRPDRVRQQAAGLPGGRHHPHRQPQEVDRHAGQHGGVVAPAGVRALRRPPPSGVDRQSGTGGWMPCFLDVETRCRSRSRARSPRPR